MASDASRNLSMCRSSNGSRDGEAEAGAENGEEESNSLLQTGVRSGRGSGRGGLAKAPKRSKRKVQWNDHNGDKLVEVREFEPSDSSDSEEDSLDSCICSIM